MSDARDVLLGAVATTATTSTDKLQPLDSIEHPHPLPLSSVAAASASTDVTLSPTSAKQQQYEQLVLHTTDNTLKDRGMDDRDKAQCCFGGYLRKRYSTSVYMGSWRYCILQGSRLRWYMTDDLAKQDSQLRGEVWVRAIEPWSGHGSVNTYAHAFAIRTVSNRVLLCSAKSQADKDAWLACLERSVGDSKRSPLTSSNDTVATHERASHTMHETRRIVPEDMVRLAADTAQGPPAPVVAIQPSSQATLSVDSACAQCAIRFGALRARRVVCSSCARAFCARHCATAVTLTHLGLRTARRCCGACAQRQAFITYLTALNRFLYSATASQHLPADDVSADGLLDRMLHKLANAPMSLVKTLKILYQTRRKPLLFRAACMRLPFYVEHCVDRVETIWYQLLHLFQCIDADDTTGSMQLLDLQRLIRAICRRSPRLALQTIWHVQAAAGDAHALHPHALLALLGFLYPQVSSDANAVGSAAWNDLLLSQSPDHQRRAILRALETANAQTAEMIMREPATPISRWLNATTVAEFEASAQELAGSGVVLCAIESSISYDSLRVSADRQQRRHLEQHSTGSVDTDSASSSTRLDALVFDQVHFVQSLAAISERLRHVQPVANRTEQLALELALLNTSLEHAALYPLCTASDELRRVVRVPPTEGKVFSTKMRAPTLIYFETVPVTATTLASSDAGGEGDIGDTAASGDTPCVLDDDDAHLQAFISSSQRSRSTFLHELLDSAAPSRVGDDDAPSSCDSLVSSSNESVTDVLLGHSAVASSSDSAIAVQQQSQQRRRPSRDANDVVDVDSVDATLDDATQTFSDATSSPSTVGLERHSERTTASAPPTATATSDAARSTSLVASKAPVACASSAVTLHKRQSVENMVYDSDVFGERWLARQQRIQRTSPFGHVRGWQLFSVIVKTNDDLRQEVFTMQLLDKVRTIFARELSGANSQLWLRTYRILATGANIGLLETINDACSLDHLKKHFLGGDLAAYFTDTFGTADSPTFAAAQHNFIASMAAYSVVCYVLLVKDRHNGNILLDTQGHIIHIDFGFILGIAPGGRFSVEDAPFKLTTEMVAIMGGVDSQGFARFRELLVDGFVALQRHHSEIAALLQTTGQHSPFPCFEGARLAKVVADLRDRLCVGLSRELVKRRVDMLIRKSYNVWGTRQYDAFQLRSNNIHP